MNDPSFWHHYGAYIAPIIVLLLIVRRAFKELRVKTRRMWLLPAIGLLLTVFVVLSSPMPSIVVLAGFVAAGAAGICVGYLRAAHQNLRLDPETGEIISKETPLGTIIFATLFAARYLMQMMTNVQDVPHTLGLQHASAAGLIFAVMMMVASRIEIWRRVQMLLT